MRLELTIDANYFPEWGVWAGIRELVSNGRDAEVEFNAPLGMRFVPKGEVEGEKVGTLIVENKGAVLKHEALLLGNTTKRGHADLVGRFGEGLKGAVLALVRENIGIKIRSGSEVWVPSIQKSEKFNANVLVFDIQTGRKEENRVRVEVEKLTKSAWDQFKGLFLFLGDEPEGVKTSAGTLLTSPEHKGKVYCKGIWVEDDAKYNFGYNLPDGEIDRDRKLISRWDLQWRTKRIWSEALRMDSKLNERFFALLETNASDVHGYDSDYDAIDFPKEAAEDLAARFQAEHGDNAIPVANLEESRDLEHLGKKGVITSKPLKVLVQKIVGSAQTVVTKLREEVQKTYSWSDLPAAEQHNLLEAIRLVNEVDPISLNEVDIVDLLDPRCLGQFKDGRVLLTKKLLTSRVDTLATLVHEVAHRGGGDGEHSHVQAIERIWAGIIRPLLE